MSLDHLPFGQTVRDSVRELRHVLRWTRQLLAEQYFTDPVAAQNGTGARCAGLLGERRGQAENPASTVLLDALDPPPRFTLNASDVVELRQSFVDERVIGVQKTEQRSVALKQIRQKQDRLLVHVRAQLLELGEELHALRFRCGKVVNMQPLAGELRPQAAHASVFEHTSRLLLQHVRMPECPIGSLRTQFLVG